MNILTVNLLFSTLVFGIAAKLYLIPKLLDFEPSSVVLPILLLHALRHLGLMFLAPGAVFPGIPQQFTYPLLSVTCSPQCWRSSRSPRSSANRGSRDLSSGCSTSWEVSISLPLSRLPPYTMQHRIWGLPIGYRLSGFRRCLSLTMLSSSFWVADGPARCEQR